MGLEYFFGVCVICFGIGVFCVLVKFLFDLKFRMKIDYFISDPDGINETLKFDMVLLVLMIVGILICSTLYQIFC